LPALIATKPNLKNCGSKNEISFEYWFYMKIPFIPPIKKFGNILQFEMNFLHTNEDIHDIRIQELHTRNAMRAAWYGCRTSGPILQTILAVLLLNIAAIFLCLQSSRLSFFVVPCALSTFWPDSSAASSSWPYFGQHLAQCPRRRSSIGLLSAEIEASMQSAADSVFKKGSSSRPSSPGRKSGPCPPKCCPHA